MTITMHPRTICEAQEQMRLLREPPLRLWSSEYHGGRPIFYRVLEVNLTHVTRDAEGYSITIDAEVDPRPRVRS
jgi:hypothetical protein